MSALICGSVAYDSIMVFRDHFKNHILPDKVHVLAHGKIRRTGGKELALELEENGYAEFDEAAA